MEIGNHQDNWQNLQASQARLGKPERNEIHRSRVQLLQDLYQERGGSHSLSPEQRLHLDRFALAKASTQWVDARQDQVRDGLASCSSTPAAASCQNAQAMAALSQASQAWLQQ